MSFLVCPLCAKSCSLREYDPAHYDLDVYVQDMRGLGRGKGFARENRRSALNDPEVMLPIKTD
jgi:hypothetical protein